MALDLWQNRLAKLLLFVKDLPTKSQAQICNRNKPCNLQQIGELTDIPCRGWQLRRKERERDWVRSAQFHHQIHL